MNPFSSDNEQSQQFGNILRGGHQGQNNRGGVNGRVSNGNSNRRGARGGQYIPIGHNDNHQNSENTSNFAPVHNPNPRYKGRNYDPNYHQKGNSTSQSHPTQLQHSHLFPPSDNVIQRGSISSQNQVRPVYRDTNGDVHMCDCGELESRHATLGADIKLFLEVLSRNIDHNQFLPWVKDFVEAYEESPLSEIMRQMQ